MNSLLGTTWLRHVLEYQAWREFGTLERQGAMQVGCMRHRLYIHLIWTTRNRESLIDGDIAGFLCRFLRAMARKERAHILEIGMVQTHIHVLARIHPTVEVSKLVKRLKGASSAVATTEGLGTNGRLYWSKGYSVDSVSRRNLDVVRAYLRSQPVHHDGEATKGWQGDTPEFEMMEEYDRHRS
jgi:REP-associated tyrosine transposase